MAQLVGLEGTVVSATSAPQAPLKAFVVVGVRASHDDVFCGGENTARGRKRGVSALVAARSAESIVNPPLLPRLHSSPNIRAVGVTLGFCTKLGELMVPVCSMSQSRSGEGGATSGSTSVSVGTVSPSLYSFNTVVSGVPRGGGRWRGAGDAIVGETSSSAAGTKRPVLGAPAAADVRR